MPSKKSKIYISPGFHANTVPAAFGTRIMENNTEQGQSLSTLGGPSPWTEHLCGPGGACCPDAVCGRAPSHGRDHDRFALRPSSNQLFCTCASSSHSTAGGASHGKQVATQTIRVPYYYALLSPPCYHPPWSFRTKC